MPGSLWWPPLLSAGAALALYAATLAPGLTWAHDGADGGDFLAAALTAGVPHPSGYPVYQLALRAALAVYPGEPARAGNWLSAICAALAVAVFADLARRSLRAGTDDRAGLEAPRLSGTIATVAALAWAASPALWRQAVITEVYSLLALIVVVLLWLLWRWREAVTGGAVAGGAGARWLVAAGLVFGIGLGVHLSVALVVPGVLAWLWDGRRQVASPAAWRWPAVAAAVLLGLCSYAYLPLAAAGNPPINWGDPRTPAGFWWLVSGRIYQGYLFHVGAADWAPRLAQWFRDAATQFGGPWGALTAVAGLWWVGRRHRDWWRATGLIALAYTVYAVGYGTTDWFVYLIPAWMVAALWLATGMAWGLAAAGDLFRRFAASHARRASAGSGSTAPAWAAAGTALVVLVLIALLPGAGLLRGWKENDLSADREARDFYEAVLAQAEPEAVILVATDRPTFALWYAIYGLKLRRDAAVINDYFYGYSWYRATLATWHPDLFEPSGGVPPASLEDLAPLLAAGRPLYRAEALRYVTLDGFDEAPAGVLVRMRLR